MTLSVTRNPDVLSGAPCIAGTRLSVASVQQWREQYPDAPWSDCRSYYYWATLDDIPDDVLADAMTYPRLPYQAWELDGLTLNVQDGEEIEIGGNIASTDLPALIAALREAEQVVREWLDAVTAWEQARTEQAP